MASKRKREEGDDARDEGAKVVKTSSTTTGSQSGGRKFMHAMICSSNMNRSCAGHKLLLEANMRVLSYGAGAKIKIPGPHQPRVFNFGTTTYEDIYSAMVMEDSEFYDRMGLSNMADRNRKIKEKPERWQDSDVVGVVDFAVCFEERIFDLVDEDLSAREAVEFKPLHIVNIETVDNAGAAAVSAEVALELCKKVENSFDELDDEDAMSELLEEFSKAHDGMTLKHRMHML